VPAGLEDVSKYPDLFDRLADSRPGEPIWTNEDLEKLAGLNLIRVLEQVEKVSYLSATWFLRINYGYFLMDHEQVHFCNGE
jgi:membrane dipeptidase